MGDYNPHAPFILGQEWVPVRDEQLAFAPWVNSIEYGHLFTLAQARTLQEARIYVSEIPSNLASEDIGVAIYPAGMEAASGPIRRVVIPVDAVAVTGVTASPSALPGPAILLTPDLGGYYLFSTNNANSVMYLSFSTQDYPVLSGKRILGVNLLYAAHKVFGSTEPGIGPQIGVQDSTNLFGETVFSVGDEIPEGEPIGTTGVIRLRLGDKVPYPPAGIAKAQWVWPTDIGRFDASSGSRLYITVKTGSNFLSPPAGGAMYFWYAALEILFCEETRVAFGVGVPDPAQLAPGEGPGWGANVVTLRTVPDRALLPVLNVGPYVVTVSGIDGGNRLSTFTAPFKINALRELYQLPTHPGIRVDLPYPPEEHLDGEFAAVTSHVLPQISLHVSGGTMTEPHAYGRLGKAPVYGSIAATQDIYDDITGGASYPFPQVRWYCRKFDTTTVPLKLDSTNVTGSGMSVQITPAEHDALPEIVDGWKEVTRRFPTAPSMGAVSGFPAWRFSSVGERAGSQWQVLSACAPAVSGVPGSLLTQATPVHRLGTATYQPGSGDTVELTWLSPHATGAVVDPDCDAVLIFSQDPATITGVSVSQAMVTVTGVPLGGCGTGCCVPTGIAYHRVTWGLPPNTGIADDDFARTVAAGGLGTASDGKSWTVAGVAADFSVSADNGATITVSTVATDRLAWVDVGGPDQDVTIAVRMDGVAGTNQLRGGGAARLTDASNHYLAELRHTSADAVELHLLKRVAGVETSLGSAVIGSLRPAATTPRMVRLQVQGAWLRAKAWDSDQAEPWWQVVTTDSSLTTGNNAGLFARDDTASALPDSWFYTSFTVRPPDHAFGGYELQRYDTVGGAFETIMLASSPAVTGFSDFEARVGVSSVYRIRALNVYQFAGAWSAQVTGSIAAPGVSGPCDLARPLILTSNADQSGARAVAYLAQHEGGTAVEGFSLPEAGMVEYLPTYGADGRVAFHGTERGLEAFSRRVLIASTTPSPAIVADARGLREVAWADLPYVCVRDDRGNRWLANARVANVSWHDDRSFALADLDITELTTTPAIIDPS